MSSLLLTWNTEAKKYVSVNGKVTACFTNTGEFGNVQAIQLCTQKGTYLIVNSVIGKHRKGTFSGLCEGYTVSITPNGATMTVTWAN